jgi:hypothetical protein
VLIRRASMREDDVAAVQPNVITKNEKAGVQLGT